MMYNSETTERMNAQPPLTTEPKESVQMAKLTISRCTVPECTSIKYYARGFCKKHYSRWWMYGDPETYKPKTMVERFWANLKKGGPDQCWIWSGSRHLAYGKVYGSHNGSYQQKLAHRFSYELHFGEIDVGLVIRHKCDHPFCVNPKHLLLGTQADNVADMVSRGRARGRLSDTDKIITCDHPDRPYLAKGKCKQCYQRSWALAHRHLKPKDKLR